MDAPIWSNDMLYLQEMLLTFAVTAVITWVCFYLSRRADRERKRRVAQGLPASKHGIAGDGHDPLAHDL
jgi:hypothetical protein